MYKLDGNRFKQLREAESERRRDINPKCELFTQEKLSKELLEKCNYYISSSKIKKLETDTDGVKVAIYKIVDELSANREV
jgi:hypothetical protein